jgi:hypothetical protein
MPSSLNHRVAKMGAGVPGRVAVASSMAFYGFSAPALLGLICLNGIPLTRSAIVDSSNGCGQESCGVSSKRSLKFCGFKAGSMSVKLSLMAALLRPKRRGEGRQNETW